MNIKKKLTIWSMILLGIFTVTYVIGALVNDQSAKYLYIMVAFAYCIVINKRNWERYQQYLSKHDNESYKRLFSSVGSMKGPEILSFVFSNDREENQEVVDVRNSVYFLFITLLSVFFALIMFGYI